MLKDIGTTPLETERLILRRFVPEDAAAMFGNWANDPEVCRHMTWPPHPDVEETKKIIAMWMEGYKQPHNYHWAIEPKELGAVIGSVGIMRVDERAGCGELGYCIGRRWWSGGLMTEAVRAVIGFAFGEAGFHRIEAKHAVENPASGRVMEKNGMRFEGVQRGKFARSDGKICDVKCYAILATD